MTEFRGSKISTPHSKATKLIFSSPFVGRLALRILPTAQRSASKKSELLVCGFKRKILKARPGHAKFKLKRRQTDGIMDPATTEMKWKLHSRLPFAS